VLFERGSRKRGGQRIDTGSLSKRAPPGRSERGSDARGRARASFHVVAEVVRQWPAQRSGRTPSHPIWIAFRDGRLARRSVRKCAAVGEETLAPSSKRKPHVTVSRVGATRAGRGRLAMEGIPDRRSKRLFTERSPTRSRRFRWSSRLAKASRAPRGRDRDVKGTVEPGVVGRKRRATNPEPPTEADRAS